MNNRAAFEGIITGMITIPMGPSDRVVVKKMELEMPSRRRLTAFTSVTWLVNNRHLLEKGGELESEESATIRELQGNPSLDIEFEIRLRGDSAEAL